MTDVNDEEQKTLETPITIGERLIRAREAKNISIAEVSSQLRLVRENVRALEAGQWSDLHGRAYARGYLISYVKFLGLPEDEFLAAFNREYETSAPEATLSNNVARILEKKSFPWFKVLLLISLIVIGWFAYQQWLQFESESAVEVMPTTETVEPVAEINSFSTSVVEPIIAEETLSSPAVEPVEVEQVVEVVSNESNEITELVADSDSSQQAVEAVVQQETIIEAQAEQQTVTETVVELMFSDDCWVNVTDSNGLVLVNKVMLANSSTEVKGLPPISVSLGRASAVSMKVNDEVFDFTSYIRGDVAKFSLGAES